MMPTLSVLEAMVGRGAKDCLVAGRRMRGEAGAGDSERFRARVRFQKDIFSSVCCLDPALDGSVTREVSAPPPEYGRAYRSGRPAHPRTSPAELLAWTFPFVRVCKPRALKTDRPPDSKRIGRWSLTSQTEPGVARIGLGSRRHSVPFFLFLFFSRRGTRNMCVW